MIVTSASPERILEAGKVYNLPRDIAEPLLEPYSVAGGGVLHFAERVADNTPSTKVPHQPDPGDTVADDGGEMEDL